MRTCFFLCIIFSNQLAGFSQNNSQWSGGVQWGYIIPHSKELVPIAKSNPTGFFISYENLASEKDQWSTCNCFHYLGLNFDFHNFQNPEILGSAMTLSSSFEPILFKRNRWQVNVKSGIGVSYLTRVYDSIKNPENTFFSSPISFLMVFSPKVRYRLTNQILAQISLNYYHISNGGQRQPNRGMNFPMLGVGFSYNPHPISFPTYSSEQPENRIQYLLEAVGTMRDNPKGSGRIGTFGLSLDASYHFAPLNALGAGLEANWDRTLQFNFGQGPYLSGVFLTHHLIFGRFDFNQRMVLYLNKPRGYQQEKDFYQRYILNYLLLGNLKAGIGMKVHGHVAENMEFRLGYAF